MYHGAYARSSVCFEGSVSYHGAIFYDDKVEDHGHITLDVQLRRDPLTFSHFEVCANVLQWVGLGR